MDLVRAPLERHEHCERFEHQPPAAGTAPGVLCPLHCDDQAREFAVQQGDLDAEAPHPPPLRRRRRGAPQAEHGPRGRRPQSARSADDGGDAGAVGGRERGAEPVADGLEAIDRREGPPHAAVARARGGARRGHERARGTGGHEEGARRSSNRNHGDQ